jgi:hypothetical protein
MADVGDYVKDDDVVALIDTEAFSFEYRAHEPGVITKARWLFFSPPLISPP